MSKPPLRQQSGGNTYENVTLEIGKTHAYTRVRKRAKWIVFLWGSMIISALLFILYVSPGVIEFAFVCIFSVIIFKTIGAHRKIEIDRKKLEIRLYESQSLLLPQSLGRVENTWSIDKLKHLELEHKQSVVDTNMSKFDCAVLTIIFKGEETLTLLNHAKVSSIEKSAIDLAEFLNCELRYL